MTDPTQLPPRVLIVDDTPQNLELLEAFLRGQGYRVFALPDGEMALKAVAGNPPDLILLDIIMPRIDGYEVCRRLKADPALREIPILFLSALGEPGDKVRAFEAGGVDYITKPFHLEEVRARVGTHLALSQQRREIQASYERLRELERLRDSLTHMIVHDIRTPLTVISLNLELLRSLLPPGQAGQGEILAETQRQTRQVTDLLSQMLDVSRLEAGRMPLNRSHADLVAQANAAIRSLGSLAGNRRLRVSSPGPVILRYDNELIGRVLSNLLVNAFKFSPDDAEVTITVDKDNNGARMAIADNGCGIPAELHNRIFEKFSQVAGSKPSAGTGLGLTFCRLAVEAHGGRIGVSSEPGRGSTFWFTLPAAPETSEMHPGGTI
jgi:signal transduction histidine kinase